jgi:MFS family permease
MTTRAVAATTGGEHQLSEQRRTLAVAAAGTLLVLVAFTTPLTTLPSTARGLAAGPSAQTWLLASISLGLAAGWLTAGAVGGDYGRRRVLVAGAGLFAAGSLLCSLAADSLVFVLGRVGQGLGGAAVLACSLGLIGPGPAFPGGPARARAAGIWGASVGASVAVGPLLAAGLELASNWRRLPGDDLPGARPDRRGAPAAGGVPGRGTQADRLARCGPSPYLALRTRQLLPQEVSQERGDRG